MGKTREIANKINNIVESYQEGNFDINSVAVSGNTVIDETGHWVKIK